MTLDRPVHASETADGTTTAAVHGDLAQPFTPPPPPDFWPRLAGSKS